MARKETVPAGQGPWEDTARAVAGELIRQPRPYTAARLGLVELVSCALVTRGLQAEADKLAEALAPVTRRADLPGIPGLAAALRTLSPKGRPPSVISEGLRHDAVEAAMRGALHALGWAEMEPWLAPWSPSGVVATPSRLLTDAELAEGWQTRRALVLALARRAREIEHAWDVFEQATGELPLSVVGIDGRSSRNARLLVPAPDVNGSPAPASPLPARSRHGNRVGRAMVAVTVERLSRAVRSPAPRDWTRGAVAVIAAVAEAVASPGRRKTVLVAAEGAPVPPMSWSPTTWWPVMDSWGSRDAALRAQVPTAWRLTGPELDALVWVLAVACARVGSASDCQGHEWQEHMVADTDPVWGVRLASAWELAQSVRSPQERSPWPSPLGSAFELSGVDWSDRATLPWGPEWVEEVGEAAMPAAAAGSPMDVDDDDVAV